ncbi:MULTISPECIES: pyridoxal phosphate-dependent aminotransferase [unclassified Cobetia]|uniref:pyridoxal phosphate-dependent aminotransferase n=1 Tax=unclassified Cobetia TaxID=2609414 RepID=UPI00178CF8B9|nr:MULTISPECIES: histidinol-phosphate transaminase [unclassified Cobetia]MBE2167903.1 histidinol-phosphate aminotransferase family protein [Cobetia sp. 2AS1]MDH2446327.1 histidinol-phosphate transaminase [Cobetia sp. 2AS]
MTDVVEKDLQGSSVVQAVEKGSPSSRSRRGFLGMSGAAIAGAALGQFLPGIPSALAKETAPAAAVLKPSAKSPVRLNYNENALGMAPSAQRAAAASIPHSNRYPFAHLGKLQSLVATHHKVPSESILFTPGSSDAIRASVLAHATPDTQLVIPELTYGDGALYAGFYDLAIRKVPSSREDWSFKISDMKQAVADHSGPSIVYLVNPNNPTSTIISSDELEAWVNDSRDDTLFIIDEAYAEFVNDPAFRSADHLIAGGAKNVLLLKTFSKIHAMAGLRVGYAVGDVDRLEHVSHYVEDDAMTLSYPGVMAATASMQSPEFLVHSKQSNDEARAIFTATLDELGWEYLPGQTNFVFHRISRPLKEFQTAMKERHVLIGRAFPPADGWCRMSLGTPEEMHYVAAVLREMKAKGIV